LKKLGILENLTKEIKIVLRYCFNFKFKSLSSISEVFFFANFGFFGNFGDSAKEKEIEIEV
jgi:hypothetical protein